jgi:hypothetical protein
MTEKGGALKAHLLYLITLAGFFSFLVFFSQTGFSTLYEDDFGAALQVKEFTETGRVAIHGFPLNPQLFHIFWGFLFVKIFGYSVGTLGFSTLTLAYVALCFLYFALYEVTASRPRSFFFAACFAVFPSSLHLAQNFMTEIPFAACIAAAAFFFLRYGKTNSLAFLFACSLSLGLGSLIRHYAVFLALGISLGLMRKNFRRGLIPLAGPAIGSMIFLLYLWQSEPSGYVSFLKSAGVMPATAEELTQINSVVAFFFTTYAAWNTIVYKAFMLVVSPFFVLVLGVLPLRINFSRSAVIALLLLLVAVLSGLADLFFDSPGQRRSFLPYITYGMRPVYYMLLFAALMTLAFCAGRFNGLSGLMKISALSLSLYVLGHLTWPVAYTSYVIPSVLPLLLIVFAAMIEGIEIRYPIALLVLLVAAPLSVNAVRHRNATDTMLWQKGREYSARYGKEHVLTGSLAYLGFYRFDEIQKHLGFANADVSRWPQALSGHPPQIIIARRENLDWYAGGQAKPTDVIEEITVGGLLLKDTIVVVKKER